MIVPSKQVSGVVNSDNTGSSAVTNRPRSITPALGLSWANLVTCRLMLQRTQQHVAIKDQHYGARGQGKGDIKARTYDANVRSMEVMFAPHLPSSLCHFIVDTEGVKGIS